MSLLLFNHARQERLKGPEVGERVNREGPGISRLSAGCTTRAKSQLTAGHPQALDQQGACPVRPQRC